MLHARREIGARRSYTHMPHSPEAISQEVEPVRPPSREDAERLLDVLDTLVDTHGREASVLRDAIIRTAQTFVGCITESVMLDKNDILPGTPWHDRECRAHDEFENAMHSLFAFEQKYNLSGGNYELPFDETLIDHLHSNTLAIHVVSQLRQHQHHPLAA